MKLMKLKSQNISQDNENYKKCDDYTSPKDISILQGKIKLLLFNKSQKNVPALFFSQSISLQCLITPMC